MTALAACEELRAADSTLSRYESGNVMPVWASVLALMRLYKVSDDELALALRLWEEARDEPPPVRLPKGTPKSFRRLMSAEREAHSVRTLELSVVPGLLQTERYARALVDAAPWFHDHPEGRVEGFIARRSNRQKRVTGYDPLIVHALIDEAAIVRRVGGAEVMREQLDHLLAMGARTNVTLQVIPFGVGAYGTMSGACTIIGYPEPDAVPSVYLEYPAGGAWVDDAEDVRRFTTMFDDVSELALSPGDTAALIHQRIRALEADEQQHQQ